MGKNCLLEVLRHRPERIRQIFSEKTSTVLEQQEPELFKLTRSAGIKLDQRSRQTLTDLVNSESHQGLVAEIEPRPDLKLGDLLDTLRDSARALVVVLDGVSDPQNVGSILRACECFGVDAVIWSKNRGPSITPSVSKASSGASELIDCIIVSNIAQSLERLKEEGFWIVSTQISAKSEDLHTFKFPEKVVLVVGREGEGVHVLTQKLSDFSLKIPMHGKIDSLNVSQALSILLFAFRASLPKPPS